MPEGKATSWILIWLTEKAHRSKQPCLMTMPSSTSLSSKKTRSIFWRVAQSKWRTRDTKPSKMTTALFLIMVPKLKSVQMISTLPHRASRSPSYPRSQSLSRLATQLMWSVCCLMSDPLLCSTLKMEAKEKRGRLLSQMMEIWASVWPFGERTVISKDLLLAK